MGFFANAVGKSQTRSVALFVLLLLGGCAAHKQVQYFAATDPQSGMTHYYKMTVSGMGGFPMDYHLQAGYFSGAAVDILRGSMPKIPTLDMPIEQEEHFRNLTDRYHQSLLDEAEAIAPPSTQRKFESAEAVAEQSRRRAAELDAEKARVSSELATAESGGADAARVAALRDELARLTETSQLASANASEGAKVAEVLKAQWLKELGPALPGQNDRPPFAEFEGRMKQLARLVWFGSLSDADVISLGMHESTDPYVFRKLVFWASASNIDLNQFSTEVDGILENVTRIADGYRQQAKKEAAEKRSRRASMTKLIDILPLAPEQKKALLGLLELAGGGPAEEAPSGEVP